MLHWLSQNYQWVFSGIGVLIVGYFIQRWLKSDPQANTEVKDSSLAGSAIAIGSGNTQTINAPTIHAENVHFGPSEAVAKQVEKIERPRANIQYQSVGNVRIRESISGVYYQGEDYEAVFAQFSNDAIPGIENMETYVKATIIYRDGPTEVRRIIGTWMEYSSGHIKFGVDESHKLIIGFIVKKELYILEKQQGQMRRRGTVWNAIPQPLHLHKFTATVRLTSASSGYCYFESEFEVHINPLSIMTLF